MLIDRWAYEEMRRFFNLDKWCRDHGVTEIVVVQEQNKVSAPRV